MIENTEKNTRETQAPHRRKAFSRIRARPYSDEDALSAPSRYENRRKIRYEICPVFSDQRYVYRDVPRRAMYFYFQRNKHRLHSRVRRDRCSAFERLIARDRLLLTDSDYTKLRAIAHNCGNKNCRCGMNEGPFHRLIEARFYGRCESSDGSVSRSQPRELDEECNSQFDIKRWGALSAEMEKGFLSSN